MANVKIDCTQIPRVQMDILCRTLLAGIERFYSDPENLRRYEAWLQKCRERKASSMTTTRRRQHQQFNRLRRIALGLFVLAVLEAVVITILAVNCASDAAPAPEETAPAPTAETSVPETEAPTASTPDEPVTEPEAVPQETEGQRFLHSDDIPLSYELQEVMQQACEDYGVPYALALAIAECESSFNLDADNGTCWGLMQVHPINYDRLRGLGIEPTDYEGNIVAGVLLIGELLDKYGDQHKALMAYNCGEGGAAKLWQQGYYSSQYSRHVLNVSESWQQIIDDLKKI